MTSRSNSASSTIDRADHGLLVQLEVGSRFPARVVDLSAD